MLILASSTLYDFQTEGEPLVLLVAFFFFLQYKLILFVPKIKSNSNYNSLKILQYEYTLPLGYKTQ